MCKTYKTKRRALYYFCQTTFSNYLHFDVAILAEQVKGSTDRIDMLCIDKHRRAFSNKRVAGYKAELLLSGVSTDTKYL